MTKMLTFLDMSKLSTFGVFEHLRRCSSHPKDAPVFIEDAQKNVYEHLEHLRNPGAPRPTLGRVARFSAGGGWEKLLRDKRRPNRRYPDRPRK